MGTGHLSALISSNFLCIFSFNKSNTISMEDKNKKTKKSTQVVDSYNETNEEIPSDVFGSYTGKTEDGEKPMQDGDDI